MHRLVALLLPLSALVGCANIAEVAPGTPYADVTAKFGKPTTFCDLADGSNRAIWTSQPFGEQAWAAVVTTDGIVQSMQPVLKDKSFERLSQGTWTPERVRCAFGPPADVDEVGLPGVRKVVWSYRYRQYDVWYSMMYVFFDPATQIVVNHYPGPDPMYMYGDIWFF
ncbi:hypothetical protein [Orrella daihaiensis]|uniref:Lipoprotein n=1 Tax=Orrella daihaiensis TaxID=2782176 RepID=A0ABY4ASI5_9BURK|nr:hypothetical protein [Orrella daihaiensis]UOD51004.1 hypothetical protein DHf2319_03605 [Orrella daihaiensis]